jgi:hypothetical protein
MQPLNAIRQPASSGTLTLEMKAVLLRTLPIEHIDSDKIVLRGPIARGSGDLGLLVAINPTLLTVFVLLSGSLVMGRGFVDEVSAYFPLALLLGGIPALGLLWSIVHLLRRRRLHISLHRGQRLARVFGPRGIDVCLPLALPYFCACVRQYQQWLLPYFYETRDDRRSWRRHLWWPLGDIPKLELCFPGKYNPGITPVSGATEADFIACWEWLIKFVDSASAPARIVAPGPILRLAGAGAMLNHMSLHSLTVDTLGLFWSSARSVFLRTIPETSVVAFAYYLVMIVLFKELPPWALVACSLVSTAAAADIGLHTYPTVTTFSRGADGAYIERGSRRQRLPEFSVGLQRHEGVDQLLLRTPAGTLRGRWMPRWIIEHCGVFVLRFCQPPEETEGVDIDLHDLG